MTKNEIRLKLIEQRDLLTLDERNNLGNSISNSLFQSEEYRGCNNILPYLSFRSEVETKKIILQSIKDGNNVYIPRVEEKDMDFYQIQDLEGLILSKFGIPEPAKIEKNRYQGLQDVEYKLNNQRTNKEMPVNHSENHYLYHNLMLLPGLAFDRKGNRLGYGAGYYDKYLSTFSLSHFYKIGLAYDFQVLDHIPADEFDMKVNAILTPNGFVYCD